VFKLFLFLEEFFTARILHFDILRNSHGLVLFYHNTKIKPSFGLFLYGGAKKCKKSLIFVSFKFLAIVAWDFSI